MDLCNPTGDTLKTMYDSAPYVFAPRSVMTVNDEAGRHIAAQGARFGLVEVHFGDDPDKIRYSGLKARVIYYRKILEEHMLVNARQAEMKFPAITDSDAVRQAKIALPIYEKALGIIEEKLGDEAAAEYAKDLDALLNKPAVDAPDLKSASMNALRDEATRLGISWKPEWSAIELREAIGSWNAVKDIPQGAGQAPVPASTLSGGPDPNMPPDDLSGPFVRLGG